MHKGPWRDHTARDLRTTICAPCRTVGVWCRSRVGLARCLRAGAVYAVRAWAPVRRRWRPRFQDWYAAILIAGNWPTAASRGCLACPPHPPSPQMLPAARP